MLLLLVRYATQLAWRYSNGPMTMTLVMIYTDFGMYRYFPGTALSSDDLILLIINSVVPLSVRQNFTGYY